MRTLPEAFPAPPCRGGGGAGRPNGPLAVTGTAGATDDGPAPPGFGFALRLSGAISLGFWAAVAWWWFG